MDNVLAWSKTFITARDLLARAAAMYDSENGALRKEAGTAAKGGFSSGSAWMAMALTTLRNGVRPPLLSVPNSLGVVKYGLAIGAALLWIVFAFLLGNLFLVTMVVLIFYAVEAQMVFLFPLALDGTSRPFRDARRWTIRAGGTFGVMAVVVSLAGVMLLGGFAGRGFLRCWCLGCLSVCIWYEILRVNDDLANQSKPSVNWFPLEFGTFGQLFVRYEVIRLGLAKPVRILYVSDLHLGHGWTTNAANEVVVAARHVGPDAILLGGDLADNRAGLDPLAKLVRALSDLGPVHAIAGNHDDYYSVRAVVAANGGNWLTSCRVGTGLRVDGELSEHRDDEPRLLCVHYPSVFPTAVAAGYRLVLAGHLHGGQCVLATYRDRLYPAAWLHRWHGLRFQDAQATMLVSRGVADTFPVRWNCPREVLVCEIR